MSRCYLNLSVVVDALEELFSIPHLPALAIQSEDGRGSAANGNGVDLPRLAVQRFRLPGIRSTSWCHSSSPGSVPTSTQIVVISKIDSPRMVPYV